MCARVRVCVCLCRFCVASFFVRNSSVRPFVFYVHAFYINPHEMMQRKANPYAQKMKTAINVLAVVPARTKYAYVMKALTAKFVP